MKCKRLGHMLSYRCFFDMAVNCISQHIKAHDIRLSSLALLTLLLFITASCNSQNQSKARLDAKCPAIQICFLDIPPMSMSRITLNVMSKPVHPGKEILSYLARDFHRTMFLFDIGPQKPIGWTDRYGGRHLPRRVYFVASTAHANIGSLWVVFDHLYGNDAFTQIIESSFDKSKDIVRVFGDQNGVGLNTIGLVDKSTGTGPTFASHYDPNDRGPYTRKDYGSEYDRREFFGSHGPCGGPEKLVPVPKAWVDEAAARERVCEKRRATREDKPWYSQFSLD